MLTRNERAARLTDCRNSVITNMSVAKERIRQGKEFAEKSKTYRDRLDELQKSRADLIECQNHVLAIYKSVKGYAIQHQESARSILESAIKTAGDLVPDADVGNIRLQTEMNGQTLIVNEYGQNVNLREGGGYRALLGALLRYACIKAQPDALPLMLFDESFFTLSDTTTQALKDVLVAMKKDVMIICIEQRKNVMAGILDSEYAFKKDDRGNTTVSKTI